MRVLDDAKAALAPLIEACRPRRKTRHHHLRRTRTAIIWRRAEAGDDHSMFRQLFTTARRWPCRVGGCDGGAKIAYLAARTSAG